MYYFIYKLINITGIGGVGPKGPLGMDGGLGSYGEWILGTTDDPKKLLLIKEFQPRIVDESVWRGFNLIGKTQIQDINGVLRDLTVDEIAWQKAAVNWEFKENARAFIHNNVGDTLDQVANVDKQVQIITPVAIRVYKLVMELFTQLNIIVPESILPATTKQQYDIFSDQYLGAIALGQYLDRIDVDPDPGALINKVLANNAVTAYGVKTELIDKRV